MCEFVDAGAPACSEKTIYIACFVSSLTGMRRCQTLDSRVFGVGLVFIQSLSLEAELQSLTKDLWLRDCSTAEELSQ